MTFPVQIHLFGATVEAHQVLELMAYGLGFALYLVLRRFWRRAPDMTLPQTAWVMVGAIFGALIGARSLALIESLPLYWGHFDDWRILFAGKTIVGAVLGGWTGVTLAKRLQGISHTNGDIYVFPLILGISIGRIGCFLEGLPDHTYGTPTSLPWGVDFGDGIPRHPAQLYEIAFLLTLAAWFLWRVKTARQKGCMFNQFVFAYVAFRFFVEFIKPRYTIPIVPLSAIQLTTLGGIIYAILNRNAHCCGKQESAGRLSLPGANPVGPASFPGANPVGRVSLPGAIPANSVLETTTSLCPHCLRKIEAKFLLEEGKIFMQKFCPDHGLHKVLVSSDPAYWRQSRNLYTEPPTAPAQRHTDRQRGCPWDCGLCPDHDQHTCLAILEVTDQCDLNCPVCYATSHARGRHRSLEEIERMLDVVANKQGKVSVLQISGGEPALHPDLFAILDLAKARGIRHIMLNTNGRRIAHDEEFVRRLAGYMPGFEIYLQFDSLHDATLRELRGADLAETRRKAIENLNRHNLSTTLVVMLKRGLNDREIGQILDFAADQPCVRGVTFQPIQSAGRIDAFDPATDRLTLSDVRAAILSQSPLFSPQDIVPIPCHPDVLAAGYAIRRGQNLIPLSRWTDPQTLLLNLGGNTISYEQDPELRQKVEGMLRASPSSTARKLKLQCCLPLLPAAGSPIEYKDIFRIVIMQFMDAWTMDLRSLKRSCVHIITPDGRLAPFESYNLLHRHNPSKPTQKH